MTIKLCSAFAVVTVLLSACDGSTARLVNGENTSAGPGGGSTPETERELLFGEFQGDFLTRELAKDEPAFVVPPEIAAAHDASENINLGRWGDLIEWPQIATGAAHLPDGRLMTWSSTKVDDFGGATPFTHGSIFDPVSETFTDMPNENQNMFCAGVAMLGDGSVFTPGGGATITTTSIFNGNSWFLSDSLGISRWYPQTTTLPSGQALTALGTQATGVSELWTKGVGWEPVFDADLQSVLDDETAPVNRWWYPALNVAPDGTLFHPGPTSELFSLDLYSNSGMKTDHGKRESVHNTRLYNTTVMYDIGKMLIAGGGEPAVNTALTIDLNGSTPIVTPVESMTYARSMQDSIVLPNGKVLVIGGNSSGKQFSDDGTQLFPEMWDPQTGQWDILAPHSRPRNYHSTGMLLKDGRVAAMGSGLCGNCAVNQQNGEIFEPPYLFNADGTRATQPQIVDGPAEAVAGDALNISATAELESFSMVRLVALTHHHTTDQRFIPLEFAETSAGNYNLQLPSNNNVLIPGYYWVFGLTANGVPSEGHTLMVNPTAEDVELPELSDLYVYEYYEGDWDALPDFDTLTPIDTGRVALLNLDKAQVDTFFGFRFRAILEIPETGTYTFFTNSDDGTQLFVDGTMVVNNDGNHAPKEEQGTIDLTAGTHDLVITYYNGIGGAVVAASMQGPSIEKQNIRSFLRPLGTPLPIAYEYYEGVWSNLPDFDNFTPVATGELSTFNFDEAQRDNNFGFRYTAAVEVPVNGTYTFSTNYDDGSQVFINGNLVVDNDGLHASREEQGSINLTAGTHVIVVTYFERGGRINLAVQMEGPTIAKQNVEPFLVSQDLLTTGVGIGPSVPVNTASVAYEYYQGAWTALPDFDSLTPIATGELESFTLDPALQDNNFGFRYTAQLALTTAGTYTFSTKSDDGSQLLINGNLVVDNDGLHGSRERQGSINLSAGTHDIVVTYFEAGGRNSLSVQMQGPSIAKQDVEPFLVPLN